MSGQSFQAAHPSVSYITTLQSSAAPRQRSPTRAQSRGTETSRWVLGPCTVSEADGSTPARPGRGRRAGGATMAARLKRRTDGACAARNPCRGRATPASSAAGCGARFRSPGRAFIFAVCALCGVHRALACPLRTECVPGWDGPSSMGAGSPSLSESKSAQVPSAASPSLSGLRCRITRDDPRSRHPAPDSSAAGGSAGSPRWCAVCPHGPGLAARD